MKSNSGLFAQLKDKLNEQIDSASLAFFRIVFGCVMLYSQIRFLCKGWIYSLYIKPNFFFKYYGFYWVHTLPGNLMYLPWVAMIICLVLIIIGKYYRVAITAFFLLFSYTELLDLTNYLNHYYLITLLSFIMIFLPMDASFSWDAKKWKQPVFVPRWTLAILRLQVGLVYFFAGLAKIKYDWLFHAEPLTIWLATCVNIPIVGKLLAMRITAYVFSWIGMLFDLTAPFLLLNKMTRPYEYIVIVLFHIITLWLFYIGIFPFVMMGVALIFFSPVFHRKVLERCFFFLNRTNPTVERSFSFRPNNFIYTAFFCIYFLWQLLMPLRYLLYKGNVLWTEQGFRYSWCVMLMEKDGVIEFHLKDTITGEQYIEFPKKYLTPLQERMMSTQPDMILQYAHFLAKKYKDKYHHTFAVFADAYVSLNQRAGATYINPNADLEQDHDSFAPKDWILPEQNNYKY